MDSFTSAIYSLGLVESSGMIPLEEMWVSPMPLYKSPPPSGGGSGGGGHQHGGGATATTDVSPESK